MTTLKQFTLIELAAVGALLLVAGIMAAYGVIDTASQVKPMIGVGDTAGLAFLCTVMFGFAPVIFFGAPIYLLLLQDGLACWLNVLFLGVLPGIILLFVDWELERAAVICGATIALLTHLAFKSYAQTISSNSSHCRT